jgi:hypothetical protein
MGIGNARALQSGFLQETIPDIVQRCGGQFTDKDIADHRSENIDQYG